MITQILRFTLPATYALLPTKFENRRASAMLLAIGLQESQFLDRRQRLKGPARGFWQFERTGVAGVMNHPTTRAVVAAAMDDLGYRALVGNAFDTQLVLEHNDVLACVFARLLLWTVSGSLPDRVEPGVGWAAYVAGWRPGSPRRESWDAHFEDAWQRVELLPKPPTVRGM